MATLINQKGQLYKRIGSNKRGYDDYQLVEDAPILRYSKVVDCPIALTEDGRIYDCVNLQLMEVDDRYKSISHTTISYDTNIYGLSEDGRLFSGRVKVGKPAEWNLVRDTDIQLLSTTGGTILAHNGERLIYGDDSVVWDYQVDELLPRVAISQDNIGFFDSKYSYIRELNGFHDGLIGCGIMYIDVSYEPEQQVLIIKDDNGELVINITDIMDISYHMNEVYNGCLSDLHRVSPWTHMIYLNDFELHLVNEEGLVVKLDVNGGSITGKIPSYIFNNRITMKNSRTSK